MVLEMTGPVGNAAVLVPAVRDRSRGDGKSPGRSIHRHRYCELRYGASNLLRFGAQLTVPYSASPSDIP